jgi:hypothetical protein
MTPDIPMRANVMVRAPEWWNPAEHGPFDDFPAIVGPNGFTSAWRLEPHEIAMLAAGGSLLITVFTEDGAMPLDIRVDSRTNLEEEMARA